MRYLCVLGDSGRVTWKSKDQLVYTSAVLFEAMRLKTVVPIGLLHKTTRDTSLGGYYHSQLWLDTNWS